MVLFMALLIVTVIQYKVKAAEFVQIKPYDMNRFEDIYDFADYATPIVNSDSEYQGYFKVEVTERGLLYFSNYSSRECNGMWDGWTEPYYPLGVYVYKSQNMLSTITEQGKWQEDLNGSTYMSKYDYLYYVMPGTYYIEVKTLYKNDNNIVFVGFLADSKLLRIEKIENVDSEKALVTFSDVGDYSKVYIIDGEMLDPEWRTNSNWVSLNQNSDSKIPDNTFEVSGNGTYTLYLTKTVVPHNNLAATSDWRKTPLMVTFTVDKTEILPKKIKISKTKLTLKRGKTKNLTVKITPENATETGITWKSSNKKVATVSKTGKVTAKKKGTCTITAVTSNGKKAKCKITVKNK